MMRLVLLSVAAPLALLVSGGCPMEAPAESPDPEKLTPRATAPETANVGETVKLTAALDEDVDSASVTFRWFQTYGRAVEIDDPNTANASFEAPSLPAAQTLRFRIDVITADGTVYSDRVAVTVAHDLYYQPGERSSGGEDELLEQLTTEVEKSKLTLAREFDELLEQGEDDEGNVLNERASGLKYLVVHEGKGDKPRSTGTVRVHYAGWLLDGTPFENSVEGGKPIEFGLEGVIDGWTEGLQLMSEGSYYRFVIPSDLGYGESESNPRIPPDSTLVFDIYLLRVVQ